ncbi:helix-turn-helix domain-containing protein [Lysobacter sp. MMG2]|uniref:helix-turn-helix domain-containing protein n=1 Tax=Lysobacter sp. MMG2 TaxID=2801338 RepID=UPI001C237ABB|nr:helix-turn-helix domain-containing protein [Lysobacter sp. MMG2]MBU8975951.1 helix-turn-helix domain-containing protein [Lysobacter sp. MMG2]
MHAHAGFETRHDARDVLGTHRHGGAYAALVIDGSHVEASPDGPIACEPGTLVLHPRWHAHGNRFGRLGATVANLDLADAAAPDTLRVLRVPDARQARAVFTDAPQRLGELIAACTPVRAPELHAWQAEFLRELELGELDVATLARRAGVSAAHASRVFAVSHGMPPQLLRRELRCRRALRLLADGLALADIAALAGFADQAHLSRTLRAATGATPSRLRGQIKCVQDAPPRPALQ